MISPAKSRLCGDETAVYKYFWQGHTQESGKGYFRTVFAQEEKMDMVLVTRKSRFGIFKRLPAVREVSLGQPPSSSSEGQKIYWQSTINLQKKG